VIREISSSVLFYLLEERDPGSRTLSMYVMSAQSRTVVKYKMLDMTLDMDSLHMNSQPNKCNVMLNVKHSWVISQK
jgi:hypothetical protein